MPYSLKHASQVSSSSASLPESEVFNTRLLADADTRKAYSGTAMKAFVRMMDRWDLSINERCAILGDVPKQTYYKWARGNVASLSRDQLERIGITLGIYKGLKLLFSNEEGALRWFKAPNNDYAFKGVSPVARMMLGGMTDIYAVRRYIDALRGGI